MHLSKFLALCAFINRTISLTTHGCVYRIKCICLTRTVPHEWMWFFFFLYHGYWWNVLCQHELSPTFSKKIIYGWLVKSCDIDVFKLAPFSLKFQLLFKVPLLASICHAETQAQTCITTLVLRTVAEPRFEPHTHDGGSGTPFICRISTLKVGNIKV